MLLFGQGLEQEFDRLSKNKKFGLVFEEHIPECTPLYGVPICSGSTVAKKADRIDDTYSVIRIENDKVTCMQKANTEIFELKLDDLVAVAQFSEAIFPTLSPIAKVKNSSEDTPWHTLYCPRICSSFGCQQLYLYKGQLVLGLTFGIFAVGNVIHNKHHYPHYSLHNCWLDFLS